jgi:Recombination endonuclease VII
MSEAHRAWRRRNAEYVREYTRRYAAENKERLQKYSRELRLKTTYGITTTEYDDLLDEQGGGCAFCGATAKTRRLCVDHDHTNGRVRGIVCGRCNQILGWYDRNKDKISTYTATPTTWSPTLVDTEWLKPPRAAHNVRVARYKKVDPLTPQQRAEQRRSAATHCPHGHLFDDQNTYRRKTEAGWRRECRECRRSYMATYHRTHH